MTGNIGRKGKKKKKCCLLVYLRKKALNMKADRLCSLLYLEKENYCMGISFSRLAVNENWYHSITFCPINSL